MSGQSHARAQRAADQPRSEAVRHSAPQGAGERGRLCVSLNVNGSAQAARVEPRVTLLDYLREELGLTGARKGCNEGACGACTVLVDGHCANACLVLVAQCEGRRITTIEGLARGAQLHPVQRAFIEADALQCGYCTPGQILSALACIEGGHARSEAQVREWMSGNLCRCACYPQITAAVLRAAREAEREQREAER